MKKTIVLLTWHFDISDSSLLSTLSADLSKYYNLIVLAGFPSRRVSDKERKYYLNHPVEKVSESIVIKRVGSKRGEGKGLFIRMIKYVLLTRSLFTAAMKEHADLYFLYSTPPFLGYLGRKLSKKAPTLYNAQDLFPDTLLQIKQLSECNPLVKFLRYKEKQVYNYNTRIVTISEDMRDTLIHNGCSSDKIDIIYNWVDTYAVHPVIRSNNTLMDELGVNKAKFIISYAGTIGYFQGMDVILDAAKILMSINSDIEFVLIGEGSYKDAVEKRIHNENITNVKVFSMQPPNRISEVYSIGDIELVTIGKGVTRTSLPSKTWQIMAAGSPVLAIVDKSSCLASLIENNNLGYAVEPENSDKLVDNILNAFEDVSSLEEKGHNARLFAEQNVSRTVQTEKYYKIISQLMEGRKE